MTAPAVPRATVAMVWLALALAWCVGILGRGYWTPDEPREADLAWRMSWQADKAVPLLAGEPFCEKPPLAYWVAGTAIDALGPEAWAARLPNLVYALLTALAVGWMARRGTGPVGGLAAATAISTFLLSYQVAIWLATDAPLLACVSVALAGLYAGYYAAGSGERLRGYSCMHAALALGFLSKSAAAWMVPALAVVTLVVWERRWRELWRWELLVGLLVQAAVILGWVWFVYRGADGPAHLKVFFWNNLAGRFAHVDAPAELQYAAAHRNTPGKYLLEMPAYLWPWTVLVVVAARRAWRERRGPFERLRPVRFAVATFVPTLAVLSCAATARNIYLAPALPGVALLLGWWLQQLAAESGGSGAIDAWDARGLRLSAALLLVAAFIVAAAVALVGMDSWAAMPQRALYLGASAAGLGGAAAGCIFAWRAAGRRRWLASAGGLFVAYAALLVGPASQVYRRVDAWQDLGAIGRSIRQDSVDRPLILFAPDETTRAFIDMDTRPSVLLISPPVTAQSTARLREALAAEPRSMVVTQIGGRSASRAWQDLGARLGIKPSAPTTAPGDAEPPWAAELRLRIAHFYALPNGRRYALLESGMVDASR